MGRLINLSRSELRFMVYRLLLCFKEVNFGTYLRRTDVESRGNGLWLQHNPDKNLLAIMSVSRQLYDEARRIFCKVVMSLTDCETFATSWEQFALRLTISCCRDPNFLEYSATSISFS